MASESESEKAEREETLAGGLAGIRCGRAAGARVFRSAENDDPRYPKPDWDAVLAEVSAA